MSDIRTALQFADAVGMPRGAAAAGIRRPGIGLAADTEDGLDMELSRRGFGELMLGAGLVLSRRL